MISPSTPMLVPISYSFRLVIGAIGLDEDGNLALPVTLAFLTSNLTLSFVGSTSGRNQPCPLPAFPCHCLHLN